MNQSYSSFPLFNTLLKKSESEPIPNLSYEEQIDLCTKISELDTQEQEFIYVIIRFYSTLIDKNSNGAVPYRPKLNKHGMKFELNNLPNKLQCILLHFIKMHNEKCREEQVRHNSF